MSSVVMSIPRLGVTYGGLEKNKELYVLSFAIDNNDTDKATLVGAVNASNETLPAIAPAVTELPQLKWVFVAASNLFERVTTSQPASLSGSGILLYPNLDPKGLLALHFIVIESQAGARDLGGVLTEVFEDAAVKGAVNTFATALSAAGNMPGAAAAAVMRAIISVVPKVLAKTKDRIWFSHNHSGFDFDKYGAPDPKASVHDFELINDRVTLTLRLRVN